MAKESQLRCSSSFNFFSNAECSRSHTHCALPGRKGCVLPQQMPQLGWSPMHRAGEAGVTAQLQAVSADQSKLSASSATSALCQS